MEQQATKAQCTECGTDVPSDAPLGLCPACLLKRAMQATTAGGASAAWGGGFEPPRVEDLVPLFPHLEVLEFVGRGGMGAVYKARQIHLDRFVAIKILPTSIADDPAFAERFAREARSLARLNHANIVTVHDFGRAGPYFYFVMEYVDGANLRQALLAKTLEPRQAMAIVPQICDALQYAHDEGIVHRDIKPENVLIDKKGRVKIADFGLAKLLQKTPQNVTLTQTAVTMGTPHYMAPEQTERPTEVDHRADIYSLGVVFYEMLTGELPLGRFAPPSQKAHCDARLDDVVFKTLEKEPDRRYQHASDVKTSVQELSSPPPIPGSARPESSNDPQAVLPYAHHRPGTPRDHSRTAWIGLILGALGFAALVPTCLLILMVPGGGFILMLPFVLVALAALVGMPVCGLLAISQIYRAKGAMGGLKLALFDALAVPLFVVNAVLFGLSMAFFGSLRFTSPVEAFVLSMMICGPVCVIGDFFAVRYAWRRVQAGLPGESAGEAEAVKPVKDADKPSSALISYSGAARHSRTAIAGAVWGSLAIIGPLSVLVASFTVPKAATTTLATPMTFTFPNVSTTPPAPVRVVPTVPRAPMAPTIPTFPSASVPPLAPQRSAGGGSQGGRSVRVRSGGSAAPGVTSATRPTTGPTPVEIEAINTDSEPFFDRQFDFNMFDSATTQPASGTARSFNVRATTQTSGFGSNARGGGSRVVVGTPGSTITWGSGGGSRGGGGSSGGGGGFVTPSGRVQVVTTTNSFWYSVNNVLRGLMFPVLALSLSAPIGATILGIIAIGQIRRSNGMLYGMGLAVADALFFPLLVADAIVIAIIVGLFTAVALKHGTAASAAMLAPVSAISLAAALVLDWWVWRRAVRAAEAT